MSSPLRIHARLLAAALLFFGGLVMLLGVAPASRAAETPQTPEALTPVSNAPVWTIDDVVRLALERNPDIQSARASYEAAESTIGQAFSGYLPHAGLAAATVRTTLPTPSAGSTAQLGIALPYTYAGVGIRQTLFDFGKVLNQIQSNKAASGAAEQESMAVRNAVTLSARKAFYDVLAADRLEVAAEKNLAQVTEIHRRAEVMVQTGARPPFDLTQANVQLASARLDLINAQTAVELAKVALLELIGVDKPVDFTLKESDQESKIESSKLDLARLRDLALQWRPEMKQADYTVEATADTVSSQIKDYLPTFSAFGFYDQYLPDYPISIRNAWGVGLGATWNVFNGFGTTFQVKQARALEEQQMAIREKERLTILADVSSSYVNLERAESNFKVATEGFDSATENLRLAKKRYEASVGTILELLVAESSLVNSEAAFVQAKYAKAIALASLETSVNAPLKQAEVRP